MPLSWAFICSFTLVEVLSDQEFTSLQTSLPGNVSSPLRLIVIL